MQTDNRIAKNEPNPKPQKPAENPGKPPKEGENSAFDPPLPDIRGRA